MPFNSGRDIGRIHSLVQADRTAFSYCATQWFASLTPSGTLIPRNSLSTNGWGDCGVDDAWAEARIRDILSWGLTPIVRIWIMNLDKSDQEWNTQNRDTALPSLPNPQPRASYEAIELWLAKLEAIRKSAGLLNMIYAPCWEFNQWGASELANNRSWCWGQDVAGSLRDWDVNPTAYQQFIDDLLEARNKVANGILIFSVPDSGHGYIGSTVDKWNAANYDVMWPVVKQQRIDPWRAGLMAGDLLGCTAYVRDVARDNVQAVKDFLGPHWLGHLPADLGHDWFMPVEYNAITASGGGAGDLTFVNSTFAGVEEAILAGVPYGGLTWFLGTTADADLLRLAREHKIGVVPTCEGNKIWNPATGMCECPSGMIWNPVTKMCELEPPKTGTLVINALKNGISINAAYKIEGEGI